MISRSRANFSLADLAETAWVGERSTKYKDRFSEQLRSFLGVDDVLLTPSGRGALYFILRAIDRPRVVIPAYTCNAVVEAAILAGKQLDYVDAEADGFNVDPERLAQSLGPDAIFIATHQFGIPCDINRIMAIASERGALVVEDAAASLGTRVDGRLTGTFGDAAFFSFDCSKLITVPMKGGAIVAQRKELRSRIRAVHAAEIEPMPTALKARFLAQAAALVLVQGPRRYRLFHKLQFEGRGKFTAEGPLGPVARTAWYRWDFTNWQALIASRQMEQIDAIIDRRSTIYAEYERRLRSARTFTTPPPDVRREWAPIRFPIRVKGDKFAFYRRAAKRGIDFAFSFTFIEAPTQHARAHALANAVLDLPFYFSLSATEIEHTVSMLRELDATPADTIDS